ncbi:helix-turn-helix transcriptional regulator [Ascidiimonas sp. W6]|uniref:helix-turn-helix domain-containing protein n=1 Tax=Ascidiimonas meishanensis TaxID=3128903 RepID=UPI0030EF3340
MKIVDRIKQFIEKRNLSLRSFDESIGMSKGYMSRQIKANASIGSDVLERMLNQYPELNPVWLLKGEGSMFTMGDGLVGDPGDPYYRRDAFAHTLAVYMDHPMVSEKLKEMIQEVTMSDQDKLSGNL